MIDIEAIRARDADPLKSMVVGIATDAIVDRRALLAYVDALVAAAGKVIDLRLYPATSAYYDAMTDLRALLPGEKP